MLNIPTKAEKTDRAYTTLSSLLVTLMLVCFEARANPFPNLKDAPSSMYSEQVQFNDDLKPRKNRFWRKRNVIPFEYINGFIIVDVEIDHQIALKFLFDTGSKHTILTDNRYFNDLDKEEIKHVRIVGSDLSTELSGRLRSKTSVQVGELDISSVPLIILDEDILDLKELTGEPVSGILGVGSFLAYAITIDYSGRQLILQKPDANFLTRKTHALPVDVEEDKVYVDVRANIHPSFTDSLRLLLDTGASLELLMHVKPGDTDVFPPKIIVGSIGFGLGGKLFGYVGRSDTVSIGPFEFSDVVTHFQTIDTSYLGTTTREGILGNLLLDRFLVTISYPNKMLYLKPVRRFSKKKPYDRSGIRVVQDAKGNGTAVVQVVNSASPAWEAGIRPGDQIISINGIPVKIIGINGLRKKLRKRKKSTVSLVVERGNDQVRVPLYFTFKLKDLI